jgi:hypothetical protein
MLQKVLIFPFFNVIFFIKHPKFRKTISCKIQRYWFSRLRHAPIENSGKLQLHPDRNQYMDKIEKNLLGVGPVRWINRTRCYTRNETRCEIFTIQWYLTIRRLVGNEVSKCEIDVVGFVGRIKLVGYYIIQIFTYMIIIK